MEKKLRQGSLCVQAGYKAKNGEPIELPIIQSTTFKYDDSDEMAKLFDLEKEGYFYTRLQNPTNDAVAAKIATLEGGVGAVLTSSGQAANFYAIFNICQAGDHFITSNEIYGGTYNLFGVTTEEAWYREYLHLAGGLGRGDPGCLPSQHEGHLRRDHLESRLCRVRHRALCEDCP